MNEELRTPRVSVPRQVTQVTPEDREENDEPFRKKLAELTRDEDGGEEGKGRPATAAPHLEAAPADDEDEAPKLGRNLDLRT